MYLLNSCQCMWCIKMKQCSFRSKIRRTAGAVLEKRGEIQTVGKRQRIKTSGRESPTYCSRHYNKHLKKSSVWKLTDIMASTGENTSCTASAVWQLDEPCMKTATASCSSKMFYIGSVVIFHVPDLPMCAIWEVTISLLCDPSPDNISHTIRKWTLIIIVIFIIKGWNEHGRTVSLSWITLLGAKRILMSNDNW